MTRSRLLLVPVAVIGLAVAGCGDKELNVDKLEDTIQEQIESRAGVKVKEVKCPDDVKAKKGDTFNCTATTTSGEDAQVRVTQQDDEGNVRYQVGSS